MSLANARLPAASSCVSDDYGDIGDVNYIGNKCNSNLRTEYPFNDYRFD